MPPNTFEQLLSEAEAVVRRAAQNKAELLAGVRPGVAPAPELLARFDAVRADALQAAVTLTLAADALGGRIRALALAAAEANALPPELAPYLNPPPQETPADG